MKKAAAKQPIKQGKSAIVVSASEFKTHCLRLMDQVQRERSEIIITKHGRPVARLMPFDVSAPDILGCMRGAVSHYGDLTSPIEEKWEADA